jgi:hypothetical protein
MSRRLHSSPQGSETDSWSELDPDEILPSPEIQSIEPLRLRSTVQASSPLLRLDDRFAFPTSTTRRAQETVSSKHLDSTSAHP